MLKFSVFLCLLIYPFLIFSQGKLLLVGGGSEENNGWSDSPYSWGIDQAPNHKVAIISFNDESNSALDDYFLGLGAETVKDFQINTTEIANSAEINLEIGEYDFFFFKGGDQYNYYRTFNGTLFEQTITEKFEEGGVIGGTSAGMAILSSVIFTAENGSVYPELGWMDIASEDFALENDFLQLHQGFIFDTHFIERGRIFRLMAFMANWQLRNQETLGGIGVDDKTAFTIDENNVGTVYGTAGVSILHPTTFNFSSSSYNTSGVNVMKLIHGHQVNLNSMEIISGPTTEPNFTKAEENGNQTIYLGGTDLIADNEVLLSDFASQNSLTDITLLVSSNSTTLNVLGSRLTGLGVEKIEVLLLNDDRNYNHSDSIRTRNIIRDSKKVLFAACDDQQLQSFLEGGPTGELLNNHLNRNGITSCFLGENARWAGRYLVTNHRSQVDASYKNQLMFQEGMGLLQTSAIIPNAIDFSTTDYYENTTSALPYLLAKYNLKYGFYLTKGTYVKIRNEDGRNIAQSLGAYATTAITNTGKYDFAIGRNVTATDQMRYTVLNEEQTLDLGANKPDEDEPYVYESQVITSSFGWKDEVIVTQNIDKIIFLGKRKQYRIVLLSMSGKVLIEKDFFEKLEISKARINESILIMDAYVQGKNLPVRKKYICY